jgi:hypothetical protein
VEASVVMKMHAGRSAMMRLRRTVYALASLAALAMAIGAGWKPK